MKSSFRILNVSWKLRELQLDIFYHEEFHVEDVPHEWFEQSEFSKKNLEDPYEWGDGSQQH